MKDEHYRQLWTQYLDVGLDAHEEEQLWQALQSDAQLRAACLNDWEIDRQLQALLQIEETRADFVANVLDQLPPNRISDTRVSMTSEPPVVRPPVAKPSAEVPQHQRSTSPYVWFAAGAAVASMAAMLIWAAALAISGWTTPTPTNNTFQHVPIATSPNNQNDVRETIDSAPTPREQLATDPPDANAPSTPQSNVAPPTIKPIPRPTTDTIVQDPSTPSTPIVPIPRKREPKTDGTIETTPMPQGEVVATIVRDEDAVWEVKPERLVAEQALTLNSGSVQLRMSDGADVTVFGPATFTLESSYLLQLKVGHVTATVPQPAIGFTVLTPSSIVVDLGTAFDVTVHDNGATGVQVSEGRVRLESRPQGNAKKETWELAKGDSQWVTLPGAEFDWKLSVELNDRGGRITGENTQIAFAGSGANAIRVVHEEFRTLKQALPPIEDATDYHALLELNGRSVVIKSRREAMLIEAGLVRQMLLIGQSQMQRALEFDLKQMEEQLRKLRRGD